MTYGPQVRGPGPWSVNSETPKIHAEVFGSARRCVSTTCRAQLYSLGKRPATTD